jgi:site-specific recombinase XerD
LIESPWGKSFDWPYWQMSGRSLGQDHPTLARENSSVSLKGHGVDGVPNGPYQPSNRHSAVNALRVAIRAENYAIRTEKSYVTWFNAFWDYCSSLPLQSLGELQVRSYLTHLAVGKNVAVATQRQALCALVFYFRHVIKKPLGDFSDFIKAKRPQRLPVVLSRDEIQRLIPAVNNDTFRLMVGLLYGTGIRLMACVRLRVLDIDFVHNDSGNTDGRG